MGGVLLKFPRLLHAAGFRQWCAKKGSSLFAVAVESGIHGT